MASHSSQSPNDSDYVGENFKIPTKYLPCVHAANQLDPIAISQMKPETHHRGKRTVARVSAPPGRDGAAVVAVVEDEEGTLARLQLYYQPGDAIMPAGQIVLFGRCYLIKEPFFQVAISGTYGLRVDHLSDILLLPHGHELLPAKWKDSETVAEGSHALRMKGNDAVGKKRWAEAENLYTTAARVAETAEEAQLAYLNRSLANLRLGRPAAALEDAIRSSRKGGSASGEKTLFREASALYQLAKYDQCLDRLKTLRTAYPTCSSTIPMIERVQARLQEQRSGRYDFRRMYEQAKATPPLIDCATYTMPVEIRDSPGKGRGVFTTRRVLAGELLICEKALGYIYGGSDHPDSRGKTDLHTYADLITQIAQRLLHNVEEARSFGKLHHGDYDAISVCEVDGRPVVDSFFVSRVNSLTNYRAPRTSLSHFAANVSGDVAGLDAQPSTTGVWPFISHINHLCISNSMRSFIGDMQLIRATKDLEAGTEVYTWYCEVKRFESYDQMQEHLSPWGFTCDCALCLDRRVTTEEVLDKRVLLAEELAGLLTGKATMSKIRNAQRVLDRMAETYSPAAKEPGGVRLELWHPYFAQASVLRKRKPSEAIEMILRGLGTLGFVISAHAPGDVAKSPKPELSITQWGLAYTYCVDAFRLLHLAYKTVSPENSERAREYMETAYAMLVGEKETIRDIYPELYD